MKKLLFCAAAAALLAACGSSPGGDEAGPEAMAEVPASAGANVAPFVGYVGAVAVNNARGGSLDNFGPAIEWFKALKKNEPIVPKQTSYARVLSGEIAILLDYDFNGEAYYTVSGQNSNNSVRIPNEFMKAVADDGEHGCVEAEQRHHQHGRQHPRQHQRLHRRDADGAHRVHLLGELHGADLRGEGGAPTIIEVNSNPMIATLEDLLAKLD